MGSSLSPVLANIYMEYFEEQLMSDIPVDIRPKIWLRYVDDVFCCFEDLSSLDQFLRLLNNIRPSITFTVEMSRIRDGEDNSHGLPDDVLECLPFLELNVMRFYDGNFTFSIYRKPCHTGNYIHAFSYQPLYQKQSVIRSLYLRAYRYCDQQFLQTEEQRIHQDFITLGYTARFIEECKASAIKGRNSELRKINIQALQELSFAIHSHNTTVKQDPVATLTLPYHPTMMKLRPRLSEMGIRLSFSSNSTLRQQLRRRSPACKQPTGSVYVINCSSCPEVYVGQTGKLVNSRMVEHVRANPQILGAIRRHDSNPGHRMDLRNPTQVFHSDCKTIRVTVEAALIHAAPTIQNNTASSSVDSNELVAPIICRSTKFNWNKLHKCIPRLNKRAIPKYKRHLFDDHSSVIRPPREMRTDAIGTPIAHSTRSRNRARSSQINLFAL